MAGPHSTDDQACEVTGCSVTFRPLGNGEHHTVHCCISGHNEKPCPQQRIAPMGLCAFKMTGDLSGDGINERVDPFSQCRCPRAGVEHDGVKPG